MMAKGIIALILATCLSAGASLGQSSDPATTARRAAQMLDQAGMALQDAQSANDRVAALTQTIRAYEEGLTALREGLRRASVRERAIQMEFDARSEELQRLLGVLGTMQQAQEIMLLLHPSGPVGTARSGMMISEVTPALQAEAARLGATLEELTVLRELQETAADKLAEGLRGVQQARVDLSQAVSDRTDLPRRFAADTDQLRRLLEGSDTLESFASALADTGSAAPEDPVIPFAQRKGSLPLPVQGTVLRWMDEADAAGIRRPGLVLATRPRALVTSPAPATIRYRGPLLDYGNVMIIEPASDTLLVIAGLAQVYGDVGEIVDEGAPLGLMGGEDAGVSAIADGGAGGNGVDQSETLYMELRQGSSPVDPATWFNVRKE